MGLKSDLSLQNIVMGFQHMFVMFGATVLVPILTGLDISVALFASGTGTLIFHAITKGKAPVYLGSSFAFIPAILAITAAESGSLSKACGGILAAGVLYIIVAFLFKRVGLKNINKLLPPHVTGSMIILIGLILAPVAIRNAGGANSKAALDLIGAGGCWAIALFTFSVGVFVKIFFKRLGLKFLATLPALIALVSGYAVSAWGGVINFDSVAAAAWFGLPAFSAPTFDVTAVSIAIPVAIVTIIEHFGDISAIGNVVGKDFFKDPGVHRTLIGDGIATSFSALIGGPANTTYSENTGTVALTGNFNPAIMRIAAVFAATLALVPKFGAIIGAVPAPVIGGISILLFGMISSVGIKTMVDHKVDLGDPRTLIVTSAMLVLGLGGAELNIGAVQLNGLGLAAIAGIFLNILLSIKNNAKK